MKNRNATSFNHLYLMFNKPYGVLCQFTDEKGRKTLRDYIPVKDIYPVGRLDFDSEGLLLLTNDGKLNYFLSDPRHKQPKTYLAQIEGIPTPEKVKLMEEGVVIEGKKTLPAKVEILLDDPKLWAREKPIRFRKNIPTAWIKILISEGRYHQVRKMTAAVGLPCLRLVRTAIGPLELGTLKSGEYRFIKRPEL